MHHHHTVLREASISTLLMKFLVYAGSGIDSCSDFSFINDLFRASPPIRSNRSDILAAVQSCVCNIEALDDYINLILDFPALYTHLNFFNPHKYISWRSVERSRLDDIYYRFDLLHLLGWMIASNRELSSCHATPCIPYTISELDVLARYGYFSHLESVDKFVFSPLLSVSHAHIVHALCATTISKSFNRYQTTLLVDSSSSANSSHINHLSSLTNSTVYEILDVSANSMLPPIEIVRDLSIYGDRVSILSAGLVSNQFSFVDSFCNRMYGRCLSSVPIDTDSPIYPLYDNCRDKLQHHPFPYNKPILIHNRDSSYKEQAHLGWRDSDINHLAYASASVFNSSAIARVGSAGRPIQIPNICDLPNMPGVDVCEVMLYKSAQLFFSTSSGPGHFASEIYGIRSILFNATTLVTGDFVDSAKIISLKHIVPESVAEAGITRAEFVHSLFRDWSSAKFQFRELTAEEISSDLRHIFSSRYPLKSFLDIDFTFSSCMGFLSHQLVSPTTAANLHSCLRIAGRCSF